jgi:hypothetical protein
MAHDMTARSRGWSLPALLILLGGLAFTGTARAALPSGWTAQEIGRPKEAGSVREKDGAFAITAGGESPERDQARKGNDQLYFVSREVRGDFEIVARLTSLEGTAESRGALMARQGGTGCQVRDGFLSR